MNKKIVWCGNSYYGTPLKVGCNHYSELSAAQGNEVLFIAPPVSSFHNKKHNKIRLEQSKNGLIKIEKTMLFALRIVIFLQLKNCL